MNEVNQTPAPMTEKELARKILAAHGKVAKALQSSLIHAKEAGAYLATVQANKTSKDFVAWCKSECNLSESTALNYVRIHKHWTEVKDQENYTSALKALRKSRKPSVSKTPAPLTEWQAKIVEAAERFSIKATPINLELFLAEFGVKEAVKVAEMERMAA